jgi:hypothetical protein
MHFKRSRVDIMTTQTTATTDAFPAIDRAGKYAESVQVALLHDHFDADHLDAVAGEMAMLGAPVLRAVWSEGHGCWFALEGCHRLRAAHRLGLMPMIVEIDEAAEVSEDAGYDLQDAATVGDIVGRNSNNVTLTFDRYDHVTK